MIEATPTAASATSAIDHGPRSSPVANARRSTTVASTASGSVVARRAVRAARDDAQRRQPVERAGTRR